ncbi:hypothetical protein FI667_g3379, partial [Globisporangium splendens]
MWVYNDRVAMQFLLREGDRGKPKAKLIASRLNALCSFADVRMIPGALTLDLLLNYHVVVFSTSQFSREELIAYNEFCRTQSPPIGFVLAESRGVLGFVFTDFSAQHIAEDEDALLEFRIHTARTLTTDTSVTVHVREPHLGTALGVGDSVCLRIASTVAVSNGTSNCEAGDAKERLVCEVESILSPGSVLLRIPSCLKTDKQLHEFHKHIKAATHMKKLKHRSTTVHHQSLRTRIIHPGEIASPIDIHQSEPGMFSFIDSHVEAWGQAELLNLLASRVQREKRQKHTLQYKESTVFARNSASSQRATIVNIYVKCSSSPADFVKWFAFVACGGLDLGTFKRGKVADIDEGVVKRFLSCPASEFQALSALVAGYASIQVMKFTGKVGPLVCPQSQFMYVDMLSAVPLEIDVESSEFATSIPKRESALVALFGSSLLQRLQQTVAALVGLEAVNIEILKNALCLGIGSRSQILVAKDEVDGSRHHVVDELTLSGRALLSPKSLGQSTPNALLAFAADSFPDSKPELCSMTKRNPVDHESWSKAHIICCDSLTLACRSYEKPFIFIDHCQHAFALSSFIPHVTETFSESLIPPDKKSNSQIFAFDHLPQTYSARSPDSTRGGFSGFELGETLIRSRALFTLIFSESITQAIKFFTSSVTKGSHELPEDGISTVWTIWSVIQRGHNVANYKDCVQEAWKICEIIPMLCTNGSGVDGADEILFLSVGIEDPHHVQLLASTACIIADSLSIQIPPVEERRKIVGKVASELDQFSLHSNPRTPSGILKSFQVASASHLLQLCKHVQPIAFASDKPEKLHAHFAQSMVNIEATIRGSPVLPDLSSLRVQAANLEPAAAIANAIDGARGHSWRSVASNSRELDSLEQDQYPVEQRVAECRVRRQVHQGTES